QAEDGIRDFHVTGVQTCALPIFEVVLARFGLELAQKTRVPLADLDRVPPHDDLEAELGLALLGRLRGRAGQVQLEYRHAREHRRSEERRVGKECRARWAAHRLER